MKRSSYPALLTAAEEGGYVVSCRDLSPLITQGDDEADALAQAADAMDEVFAAYMSEGLVFPVPSERLRGEHVVSPPAETAAKAALYVAMREAGVSKVELARRLGGDEEEVRRRIAEAVGALGWRLVIGLERCERSGSRRRRLE